MGQQDVKQVLKKERTWLISNEIAKKAGYSLKSIQSSLRRLVKWGQIEKSPASKVIEDKGRLKDRSFAGYAYRFKEFKTISDQDFSNKRVLLLTDLSSIKTIKELYLQPKIKLAVLPHKNKDVFKYSDFLSSKLNKKVIFIENIFSKETEFKLKSLKEDQIILFNNIKSLKEEKKETKPKKHAKSDLVKALSPYFDYFVNDAFSIADKSYAATVGFTYLLPSFIGRSFQKELEMLDNLKQKPEITFILAGAKSKHLIKLMEKNNKKENKFLIAGLFSHLCLKEKGLKLGNQEKILKERKLDSDKKLKNLLKNSENITLPVDFAISNLGNREDITLDKLPTQQIIHDLGNSTIQEYVKAILDSKVIFLKGLPSHYKEENFHLGTELILKALQDSKAEIYILGEETLKALKHFKIQTENFKLVSKNSESALKYLNDEKLPVLEILKEKV